MKLTPEEKDSCEGNISSKECLDALKSMGNGKSPGLDGLTVKFYNFFSKVLCHYLVRDQLISLIALAKCLSLREALL